MWKNLAVRLFKPLGLTPIPTWRLSNWDMACHLADLFEARNVDCVLDVGGNMGQFRDFLRDEVGYKGEIISFEPLKEAAKLLTERAVKDSAWTVYNYALGREDRTAEINVTQGSDFSSFLTPTESKTDWLRRSSALVQKQSVEMRRLDSLIAASVREWPRRNVYLKLDVQGFELEVAEGAQECLPRMVALQAELSLMALYENIPDVTTSLDYFRGRGFDVTGMFVVGRDEHLRAVDFDCVMVNSKLL